MEQFRDKVAVITGAASGIGLALAERCAQEGMKVVLSGINYDNLVRAADYLEPTGAELHCVQADVSKHADMEALADETLAAFGAVDLLIHSAGVAAGTSIWGSTLADWQWIIDVNLWGTIYCLHTFIPIMLEQKTPSHFINICSTASLVPYHPVAPYQVTKHAVLALTENLYHTMTQQHGNIGVTAVCPGFVRTNIADAERNRPPELRNAPDPTGKFEIMQAEYERAVAAGIAPEEVADAAFDAMRNGQFYVLTHPEYKAVFEKRMQAVLDER